MDTETVIYDAFDEAVSAVPGPARSEVRAIGVSLVNSLVAPE